MLQYGQDPYFQPQVPQFPAQVLNWGPYGAGASPQTYCFSGNAYSLKSIADNNISDFHNYRCLRINITGNIRKAQNICCFVWTVILGSILLIPLFFICCDWWKRTVSRLYEVEDFGYEAVARIMRASRADELYIMVQDNLFDEAKATILLGGLQHSRIHNLVFCNVAPGFNAAKGNYSKFSKYMRPLKSSVLRADISWGNKVVADRA